MSDKNDSDLHPKHPALTLVRPTFVPESNLMVPSAWIAPVKKVPKYKKNEAKRAKSNTPKKSPQSQNQSIVINTYVASPKQPEELPTFKQPWFLAYLAIGVTVAGLIYQNYPKTPTSQTPPQARHEKSPDRLPSMWPTVEKPNVTDQSAHDGRAPAK